MIKPEELRLGNKLLYNKKVVIVTGVDAFGLIDCYADLKNYRATQAELSGVPLTEEWLIKVGFQTKTLKESGSINYWYKMGDASVNYFPEDGTFYYVIHDDKTGFFQKHIIYIHQLQNLHFALKGEELEFKE